MTPEQTSVEALVERVREGLSLGIGPNADDPAEEQFEVSLAALDSLTAALREKDAQILRLVEGHALQELTAALERAERDREVQYRAAMAAIEGRAKAEAERDEHFSGRVQANRRARKAEAVVEAYGEALKEIAEDRVPTTYGGGARAMRVRANHALTAYDEPPTEQAKVQPWDRSDWPERSGL